LGEARHNFNSGICDSEKIIDLHRPEIQTIGLELPLQAALSKSAFH